MVNLTTLAQQLEISGAREEAPLPFEVSVIPSDVEVLQILVENREELPIFISATPEQILCIAYLFTQDEVKEASCHEMNHAMLAANIAMPLSAFSLVDNQYVIYGALSVASSLEDIVHEIETLSSNSIDAIEAMSSFLK